MQQQSKPKECLLAEQLGGQCLAVLCGHHASLYDLKKQSGLLRWSSLQGEVQQAMLRSFMLY
jgi:hypothetical protein